MRKFNNDKRNGKGTYYFPNGEKYEGDWLEDKRTGQGVYCWVNGDRYKDFYSLMFISYSSHGFT